MALTFFFEYRVTPNASRAKNNDKMFKKIDVNWFPLTSYSHPYRQFLPQQPLPSETRKNLSYEKKRSWKIPPCYLPNLFHPARQKKREETLGTIKHFCSVMLMCSSVIIFFVSLFRNLRGLQTIFQGTSLLLCQ